MRPDTPGHAGWLAALRGYLLIMAAGNLVWEAAQLPFYTIWRTGSWQENAFAVVHCTGGDLLIGTASLTLALVLAGDTAWPVRRFRRVAMLAIGFGIAYTAFSEWLNIVRRAAWAYSDLMPIVAIFGFDLGLSPLAQWLVVPMGALLIARRLGGAPPASR